MDVDSSATIKHIWIVAGQGLHGVGRANILRFYWDGEETPSVEVPLSDFFAIGHETFAPVTSAMVVDIPMAGRLLLADQAVAPGLADPLADSREPDVYSR